MKSPSIEKTIQPTNLHLVENKNFENQIIELDGMYYKDCTFATCMIRWNGGEFRLENIRHDDNLTFEVHDSKIVDAIDLMKACNFLSKRFSESWQHIPPLDKPKN